MVYVGDVLKLRTFDGEELVVPDEENRFLAYVGFGAPPIQYITQRGYKQHGETKVDYLLDPRTVTIDFWKKPACDRATYWANRLALHDLLRPNRGGSIELTLIIPDGSQRSILLDPTPGALFDTSQQDDNNWEINETLEFIAFDPVWYDALSSVDGMFVPEQNLVFPITFPIWFGHGGAVYTATIQYNGSWRSYPILTVGGPYTNVSIENETTGAIIELIVPIAAGDSRIIDLTPGAISIVDQSGASQFGDLGANSNLVDFAIEPHPIAPNGLNIITASISPGSPDSSFTVDYRGRYFGL